MLDETTYYFSAFALDQNNTIIDVQSKSITVEFLVPATYKAVQYITSSWTQYIRTWISASNTLSFDFAITPNTSYVSEYAILWNYWSANALFMMFYQNQYRLHNGWKVVDWPAPTNQKTLITIDNTWYTINGVKYNCATQNNYWWTVQISLFSTTNWSTNTARWRFSLRRTKISDNGNLVRDFVPCYRKSDSVVWLFDRVNKIFYTNNGTWSFTKWPDL